MSTRLYASRAAAVLPSLCSIWNICAAYVFLLTMERVDRPQYGKQPSSTAAYEAGLKAAFMVTHEPLPRRMEELLERLQMLEGEQAQRSATTSDAAAMSSPGASKRYRMERERRERA
jgi:hypothetical protein